MGLIAYSISVSYIIVDGMWKPVLFCFYWAHEVLRMVLIFFNSTAFHGVDVVPGCLPRNVQRMWAWSALHGR